MNRIVVIEDDPAILRGLTDTLRAESYDVLPAADGEDGYRLALDEQPDLVILDLMLPRMNGYDICREIRRHGRATPILMLTAQGQETSRVEGFEAGADDYVTKPFSIRELLGRGRAILKRSEGRSDLANQKELDEARRIQQRLMPSEIPQIPGFGIAAMWRPARITAGDYFDVLKFDDRTAAMCIADVAGKGMPAAMLMSNLQAAVRAYAAKGKHPRDVCAQINRVMYQNIQARGFITFFYAVLDGARKRLTYCNAGHNPPILSGGGDSDLPQRLDCGGPVLGVLEHCDYAEATIRLPAGGSIVMYTDGITECRNPTGDEFGEDRLAGMLARRTQRDDAAALTTDVIRAAAEFSNGHFEDDLTVLAVTVH
jgi:serine phosphatase RsbU (regulator of sigma subunit)